jgi:Raf kinase inhibitor-like YbhB/YbcL family protein
MAISLHPCGRLLTAQQPSEPLSSSRSPFGFRKDRNYSRFWQSRCGCDIDAFKQNGHIQSKFTCEGKDVSSPLAWEGVPDGAKSLVLIIDDPDAPDPKAPKMVWVHWVVYNLPPDTESMPENAGKVGLPQGTSLGLNDFKKTTAAGVHRSADIVTFINSMRWIPHSN